MKNSSRLEEKIEQNLTRSSSGWLSSAARSSTRALNSTQESSRFSRRASSVTARVGIDRTLSVTRRGVAVREGPGLADLGAERVDQLTLEVRDQALRFRQQIAGLDEAGAHSHLHALHKHA